MTTRTEIIPANYQPIILTPKEVVAGATEQARLLMDIVTKTGCFQTISGKKYLQVEAWETIGAFNRCHAVTENVLPILQDDEVIGYKARVNLYKDGQIVGGAEMPCYFTENCCKGKEGDAKHKASMSAAQTFATSKAYRMNYSYIAILAGYQPTPAEEMGDSGTSSQGQPTAEHWCKEHNTAFFMRGKMKAYAHPIGDTKEWCHEQKDKPPVEPEPPTETTAAQICSIHNIRMKFYEKTERPGWYHKVDGTESDWCDGKSVKTAKPKPEQPS